MSFDANGTQPVLTLDELLEMAKAARLRGRGQYRDAVVEVGYWLHRFAVSYVRQGDGMREAIRFEHKFTYSKAVQKAANAIGVRAAYVHRRIAIAKAVELLSDSGNLGTLSYAAIRQFYRFVRRLASAVKYPARRADYSELVGTWEIKPGFVEEATTLFRKAVQENWDSETTTAAVLILYDPDKKIGTRARPEKRRAAGGSCSEPTSVGANGRGKDYKGHTEGLHRKSESLSTEPAITDYTDSGEPEETYKHRADPRKKVEPLNTEKALDVLASTAKVTSAGDVAEMCLRLVEAAEDPWLVAQRLMQDLSKIKKKSREHCYA